MPDRRRIVDRLLHRPQNHHRDRRIKRIRLDRLQKLREDLGIADVANLYAKPPKLLAEHLDLLLLRRLVKTRKDLHPVGPKLFRHRLVRCDHALLNHLMRFVVGARDESRQLLVLVQNHLGLGNLDVKRAVIKADLPELLRELGDVTNQLGLPILALATNDRHHLLVSIARLGANDRLRERTGDHLTLPVEGHENGERVPVLIGDERAESVTQHLRQHRHDLIAQIDARRALIRLAIDGRTRTHIIRDIRDMHP